MKIHVSLELRRCICMEMRDSTKKTSIFFNLLLAKTAGTDPANMRGVCMENITPVEDIAQAEKILYNIDLVDESMIAELAMRGVGKYPNTVQLIPYISQICSASNINTLFKAYRCPSCDTFNKKA